MSDNNSVSSGPLRSSQTEATNQRIDSDEDEMEELVPKTFVEAIESVGSKGRIVVQQLNFLHNIKSISNLSVEEFLAEFFQKYGVDGPQAVSGIARSVLVQLQQFISDSNDKAASTSKKHTKRKVPVRDDDDDDEDEDDEKDDDDGEGKRQKKKKKKNPPTYPSVNQFIGTSADTENTRSLQATLGTIKGTVEKSNFSVSMKGLLAVRSAVQNIEELWETLLGMTGLEKDSHFTTDEDNASVTFSSSLPKPPSTLDVIELRKLLMQEYPMIAAAHLDLRQMIEFTLLANSTPEVNWEHVEEYIDKRQFEAIVGTECFSPTLGNKLRGIARLHVQQARRNRGWNSYPRRSQGLRRGRTPFWKRSRRGGYNGGGSSGNYNSHRHSDGARNRGRGAGTGYAAGGGGASGS